MNTWLCVEHHKGRRWSAQGQGRAKVFAVLLDCAARSGFGADLPTARRCAVSRM